MKPTLNLPNSLTFFRILLIPAFVMVFYLPYDWARPGSAIVFSLAAITDWLDGYFARKLGQTSPFGAFLDPVADKLMVATALVLIVQTDPRLLVALSAAIIIGREIAISALRELMSELGARHHVAVSKVGKYKTIFQITALIMMLYEHDMIILPMYDLGFGFLLAAAIMTLWSMVQYMMSAWPHLRSDDNCP